MTSPMLTAGNRHGAGLSYVVRRFWLNEILRRSFKSTVLYDTGDYFFVIPTRRTTALLREQRGNIR